MGKIGRVRIDHFWGVQQRRSILLILPMVIWVSGFMFPTAGAATQVKGFFYSGDGQIHLTSTKNGKSFDGRYRKKDGKYNEKAYQSISSVFGVSGKSRKKVISLRLIEYFDYLEDKLAPGGVITITSGYRAPKYNANLRKRGALAAKASLHQYGMAADIIMEGVPSKRVWEYVRSLGFGGTGYYHGKTVHVDVGPARFWDEKSSGVGTGLSDENKLIGLVTDYDYFAPGDTVRLGFIRMTAFPIKLHPEFELIPANQPPDGRAGLIFKPDLGRPRDEQCPDFTTIDQMAAFSWVLPSDLAPGRYIIRARFCGKMWDNMPDMVSTPEFEVRLP